MKRFEAKRELVSLRGAFLHKLGEQNRVSLPSNFREALSNRGVKRLVAVKYPECLRAWPEDEFEKREARFDSPGLDLDDEKVGGYLRYLYGNITELEIDSQGRIIIPDALKIEFSLGDQVLLLGMGGIIELWNPDHYNFKQRELQAQFGANRNYVAELLAKRKQDEGT